MIKVLNIIMHNRAKYVTREFKQEDLIKLFSCIDSLFYGDLDIRMSYRFNMKSKPKSDAKIAARE